MTDLPGGSGRAAGGGRVLAVCLGPGGVPKRPVPAARLEQLGLVGDGHRSPAHGGARRALCLFALEDYRRLEAAGVATRGPGTFGENVLTEGLDYGVLLPGDRLRFGTEAEVEIDDFRAPCATLRVIDPRFPDLMLGRSGFLCRVVHPGELRAGQSVRWLRPQ